MDRIIFIDIDGPIINTPCYYLDLNCSLERSVMNTQALGYVTRLAKLGKAKIVTNTTHNTMDIEDLLTGVKRTVKDDLVKWGIDPKLFHDDWHTSYPNPQGGKYGQFGQPHGRLRAIEQWQDVNGQVDWVCFDDEPFTDDSRLVQIDFEMGIDFFAFETACKLWNLNPSSLIF